MTLYDLFDLDTKFGAFPAQTSEASISEGDFLYPDGSTEATTSTYNSSNLINVSKCDANGDEAKVCGIAGADQSTSGGNIPVYTKGIFLMQASAAVTVSNTVCLADDQSSNTGKVKQAESGGRAFGVALTGCSSGDEYILVLVTHWGLTGADG